MTLSIERSESLTSDSVMIRADETFSTLASNETEDASEFPIAPTFSGANWLDEAVEELEWEPVEGVEDRFLDLKELYVGKRFAAGASGRLYHGLYMGEEVAVKILRTPENEEDRLKLDGEFRREVTLLYSVDHPNIVRLIGACCKEDAWCMVTEYLGGGNLKNVLRAKKDPLPWKIVLKFASDIVAAMVHLHSKGIIHRDLKSDNMVFDSSGKLKLTDFGISRLTNPGGDMTAEMGTFRWMAPEVIDHLPYTEKIDVYSFGIVLWEIITRKQPFSELSPIQAAFAVVSKNARPPVPETTLESLGLLMEQCWLSDWNERPSFVEISRVLEGVKRDMQELKPLPTLKNAPLSRNVSLKRVPKKPTCCVVQ